MAVYFLGGWLCDDMSSCCGAAKWTSNKLSKESTFQGRALLRRSPTDGADDARVAGHGGFRVDVQQTHVLDEGVGYRSVELLGVDDGRAHLL